MKQTNLRAGYVVNLTQHAFSAEQLEEFKLADVEVLNLDFDVANLITFNDLPVTGEIKDRARKLAHQVWGFVERSKVDVRRPIYCLIGGAPFFMGALEKALGANDLAPIYAFSKRVVSEDPETGTKTSVFKHEGFVLY